jgi:hypothetical protein
MWKASSLYGLLLIRFISFILIVLVVLLILSAAFGRFIIMSKIWLRLDFSDDSPNKVFIMFCKEFMEVQFGLI